MKFLSPSIILIAIFVIHVQSIYAVDSKALVNSNETIGENMLTKYWSWWMNSPEDYADPDMNYTHFAKCSEGRDAANKLVFFLNPFQAINRTTSDNKVSYDCRDNPIPKGYSIMFPFLTSYCSQGDEGNSNKSYDLIRDCALDLERGTIHGVVVINDKVVLDISKDNGNGIEMKGLLHNNLSQNITYYKELFTKEFVDLFVTNNASITQGNNWANAQEFKDSPTYYKAVMHCECVIINSSKLPSGTNILRYDASSHAGQSSLNSDKGWVSESSVTYTVSIK